MSSTHYPDFSSNTQNGDNNHQYNYGQTPAFIILHQAGTVATTLLTLGLNKLWEKRQKKKRNKDVEDVDRGYLRN